MSVSYLAAAETATKFLIHSSLVSTLGEVGLAVTVLVNVAWATSYNASYKVYLQIQ